MRTYSNFVYICKYLSKMYPKYKFFNIVVHKMLVNILKKSFCLYLTSIKIHP